MFKRKGKGSQVLNNSYNRQDIDFVTDKLTINIHEDYADRVSEHKDMYGQYHLSSIQNRIDFVYKQSYWNNQYGRKIPISNLYEIYCYFQDSLKLDGLTHIELFTNGMRKLGV